MLVADQEPRNGIKGHRSFMEIGGEGVEQLRGDGEEWNVLQIWIEVEAIAGHVMGIVGSLPPCNAYSGEAISCDDLSQSIQAWANHDVIMAGIVPYPSRLDPEITQNPAGGEVRQGAGGGDDQVNGSEEEGEHEAERKEHTVALFFEKTELRELGDKAAVILGNFRGLVVGKVIANEKSVEQVPGGGGMVGDESVGDVLAGEIEERDLSAGMVFDPIAYIVHLSLDGNPQIGGGFVLLELLRRNVLPLLRFHGHCTGRYRAPELLPSSKETRRKPSISFSIFLFGREKSKGEKEKESGRLPVQSSESLNNGTGVVAEGRGRWLLRDCTIWLITNCRQ